VLTDEPTREDRLGRRPLARVFADLANACQTPLVVGVYGTWGSGKTTFLQLVEGELDAAASSPVWFNAWQHDQDQAPAVSLLHAMVDALQLGGEFRQALAEVAVAFGSVLLQKTTTLSLDNLAKVKSLLDEESFRVRDARSKLKVHFAKVLHGARNKGHKRIVFFIDDLDRCAPVTVLRILEAIKLYFNSEGCVFFLGFDRDSIEATITSTGVRAGGSEAQYLDKMIQLPFFLPPVADATFRGFVSRLLPADLGTCLPVVLAGLDHNPRSAKRFVNNLILRHRLAVKLQIPNYDPRLLALLLLVEQLQPQLFRTISADPGLLVELRFNRGRADAAIASARLRDALYAGYVPKYAPVASYISLTDLDIPVLSVPTQTVDVDEALAMHRVWLRSFRKDGERALLRGAKLSGKELRGALLREVALETADLNGVVLTGADLRRAELAGASLANADLRDACLRFADLREADLSGAVLRGADLRGADLSRTNLRGADLSHALGLTREQIQESVVDGQTRLPIRLLLTLRQQAA